MAVVGNVRTVTRDFEHWVRTVDPTREQEMRKTLEYEFGSGVHRRLFYADPNKRGAYGGPRPILPPIPVPGLGEYLLFDDGSKILLEDSSGALLLEDGVETIVEWVPNVTMTWGGVDTNWYDPNVVVDNFYFLLEDGSNLMLESDGMLLLEDVQG